MLKRDCLPCWNMAGLNILVGLIGVLVLVQTTLVYGIGDKLVWADYCDKKLLTVGQPHTFQDVCGDYASVIVNISHFSAWAFPFHLTAYIDDPEFFGRNSFTVQVDQDYVLSGQSDITWILGNNTVEIANTMCDGRYVIAGLHIESDDGSIVYEDTTVRRTACNFSSVNVTLNAGTLPNTTLYFTNSTPTLATAYSNFASQISGSIVGPLPPSDPADAGPFVGVFVVEYPHYWKKKRSHEAWSYWNDVVTYGKRLGPVHSYTDATELNYALQSVLSSSEVQDEPLYGSGAIVVSVDVFGYLRNSNSSNTTALIVYESELWQYDDEGECSASFNAWYPEQLIIKSDHWSEYAWDTHDWQTGWSEVYDFEEKQSFLYLDAYRNYTTATTNFAQCLGLDSDGLKHRVMMLHRKDVDFFNAFYLPILQAPLVALENFFFGSTSNSTLVISLQHLSTSSQITDTESTFNNGTVQAFIDVAYIIMHIDSITYTTESFEDYLQTHLKDAACDLMASVETAKYVLHDAKCTYIWGYNLAYDYSHRVWELAYHLMKVRMLLWVSADFYFTPEVQGLDHLLNATLEYVWGLEDCIYTNHTEHIPFFDLFSNVDVDRELNNGGGTGNLVYCAESPVYLKKIGELCRNTGCDSQYPITDFQGEICEEIVLREFAAEYWNVLGLFDIWSYFMYKETDHGCAKDVLEPTDGPMNFALVNKTSILKGIVSTDYTYVCLKKMAVCDCAECDGGSTSSPPYPWTTSSPWWGSTFPYK